MPEKVTTKPVFLLTHSRSCSTAIERIFWTNDSIRCFHEDFGGAFYFGPEKVSDNWKHWTKETIINSGQSHMTWRIALEEIYQAQESHDHVFIKDMSYHIIPPKDSSVAEIPSLRDWDDGAAEIRRNPTWLPTPVLNSFRFAFLIRSPWLAVPSLYRLHVPPNHFATQPHHFKPAEIGYREMRVLIEYLYPHLSVDGDLSDDTNGSSNAVDTGVMDGLILIDASHVLANPEEAMAQFCQKVGLPFTESMLSWDPHNPAMEKAMSKFQGFHDDVIASSGLRRQTRDEEERKKTRSAQESSKQKHQQDGMGMEMSKDEYMSEWASRYGEEAAEKILAAVELCQTDYAWLKRFVMKPKLSSDDSA